ncbi:MAG: nuclear transport factor 2 family protein [Actinomycetia bacterium]|nr:nuclear transport factor 2 family protein [Actinomycetes bacterium]
MDNIQLIRDYLGATVPGQIRIDKVREFLADDVKVDDPLMALEGADTFVAALASTQEAAPPGAEGAMSSTTLGPSWRWHPASSWPAESQPDRPSVRGPLPDRWSR